MNNCDVTEQTDGALRLQDMARGVVHAVICKGCVLAAAPVSCMCCSSFFLQGTRRKGWQCGGDAGTAKDRPITDIDLQNDGRRLRVPGDPCSALPVRHALAAGERPC
eukprot:scaffold19288_cov142-Isochrysis_galbana.AAC.2